MMKVRKSGFLWTIPLLVTICLVSFPAYAKYSGGTGEPNDPYEIATAEDLMLLGDSPNDYDKNFMLIADIDLSSITYSAAVIPDFSGVFDGKSHMISYLTINGVDYLGLFGRLASGAEVKNLGVVGINIDGSGEYIGGLVGYNRGFVTQCYSSGIVSGEINVGGLVGLNRKGYVTRSYSTCSVDSIWGMVGGLAGRNNNGDLIHCYSTGAVSGDSSVGGLVGWSIGYVINCYSSSVVRGNSRVGGLLGFNNDTSLVAQCYSTGPVTGSSDTGGLLGFNEGFLTHSYSISRVTGSGTTVGGLVGASRRELKDEEPGVFVAGFDAACFWDMETSRQSTSAGGTGLKPAELQNIQTYLNAGWDFVNEIQNGTSQIWYIPKGGGYPVLTFISGYRIHQLQGLGIPESPYLIFNSQDLGAMIYYNPYAHYRLATSIDLDQIHWSIAVIPSFAGTFDGNGHTISNLMLEGVGYLGLFGLLRSGAGIRNLGLVDVSIFGSSGFVGGLAGYNWFDTNVLQCYSTGTVSGEWFVGGLVGGNTGNLSDCYSVCRVDGDEDVGGFVGNNYGTIKTCYSTGNVTGNKSVGGLVGDNGGSVTHCFWDTESSGQRISAGGNGKTSSEMQLLDTFIDWGGCCSKSKGVWTIDEGRDYPRLRWENMPGHVIEPIGPCIMHATSPSPPDGVVYEDTWVSLSWLPGVCAASHRLYFGENFDDVNNGTGDTYRGYGSSPSYNLGLPGYPYSNGLIQGTTYYWRIDELNNLFPESPWKGDVWSFTVPHMIAYNPSPADDTIREDISVSLEWLPGDYAVSHDVYFGDNFEDVNSGVGGTFQGKQAETAFIVGFAGFPYPDGLFPGTTYYWRIDEVNDLHPKSPWKGDIWSFTIPPYTAFNPNPPDGATLTDIDVIFSWMPGLGAILHTVYFGDNLGDVNNATGGNPQEAGFYTPDTLELDKTYYWRVDEFDGSFTYRGNIWSITIFDCNAMDDYIVIDDFESYNDLDPADPLSNRIFLAWIDGFDDPAHNGSLIHVGHQFIEHNVVHCGNQSMPFFYDNAVGKSEATLTLTDLRDWTVEGVKVLSLWFYGGPGNDPEPMFVAIAGAASPAAVVYHGNPDAVLIDDWTEWTIDLQEFADQSVDLTNINSITLGFGNRTNPVAGGSGLVFFDDIRLYRTEPQESAL